MKMKRMRKNLIFGLAAKVLSDLVCNRPMFSISFNITYRIVRETRDRDSGFIHVVLEPDVTEASLEDVLRFMIRIAKDK